MHNAATISTLLETAPFAVVVYEGPERRVTLSNPRHNEMVGGRHELGKPLLESMPEIAGQPIIAMLDHTYQTGETTTVRAFAVQLMRDGVLQDCYFDITSQPMRDADGKITGVLNSAVEVTDHVRARQRIEFLSQVSSAFVQAELDRDSLVPVLVDQIVPSWAEACSVVLRLSDGSLELAGWKHANPIAEAKMRELIAKEPGVLSSGLAARMMKAEGTLFLPKIDPEVTWRGRSPAFMDFVAQHPLGSLISVPLRTGRAVFGALTAIRPPSARTMTHEDKALLEEIANLASLAIETAQRYAETRAAVRLRDDFLAIASHELRTPLTSLQLQLEAASHTLERDESPVNPKLSRKLETANRQVARLSKLVDNLLDVSRISLGKLKLELEDLDVSEVVREAAERQWSAAQAVGCGLSVKTEPGIKGRWDRVRIEQVLTNLLTNALKYGAGKPVEVSIERHGERARIVVRDYGLGVRPEDRARIFDRFERAVPSANYGGLGLGLYISKQIVEAHGGTIDVSSVPDQGATFTVELPYG